MIFIRPFKTSDFDAFEPIEPLGKGKDSEFAQAIEDSGLAVTGIRDGIVIGCGGTYPTENEDIGEMWLRLSKDCLKHKIDTLRWIKDGLKIIEETYPFKQLNATVECCYERGIKLIEYLGFKRTEERTCEGKKWVIYNKKVK